MGAISSIVPNAVHRLEMIFLQMTSILFSRSLTKLNNRLYLLTQLCIIFALKLEGSNARIYFSFFIENRLG